MEDNNDKIENSSYLFQIKMNMLIKKDDKYYLLSIASNKSRDFAIILVQQSSYVYCKKYDIEDFKQINFFKYHNFGMRECIDIMINLFQEKKDKITLDEEENIKIKLTLDIEIGVSGIDLSIGKETIEFTLINDYDDQMIKNTLIWFSVLFLFQEKENFKKLELEQKNEIMKLKQQNEDLRGMIEELKNYKVKEYISEGNILNNNNKIKDKDDEEEEFNKSEIINKLNIDDFNFVLDKINSIFEGKTIRFKKIYSATKNGDSSQKFHELCDNHYNTLILVQTVTNNIFGGFTSKVWNSMELGRKKDSKSFLFSLNQKKIYNPNLDDSTKIKYHLYCSENEGPCFYAFSIENNCLKNGGICDEISKCNYDSFKVEYELNNGIKNFKIRQLEIYEIILEN